MYTRVCDIEGASDLVRVFPLNDVGYRLAEDVQQSLDVQVVGSLSQRRPEPLLSLQPRTQASQPAHNLLPMVASMDIIDIHVARYLIEVT